MKIGIITPAPPRSRYGNRVTALRWARILKTLGHRVEISQDYQTQTFELLIALHARRSHHSIKRFHRQHPNRAIVVALTGTDLYRDLRMNEQAPESLRLAKRIVVLQPKALDELEEQLQRKVRVIYQSVETRTSVKEASRTKSFDVCVIGHLRSVKDPFRTAKASRLLSNSSHLRVIQVGEAMSDSMAARAHKEERVNSRYLWTGGLSRARVRRVLSRSQACVVSSKMEGGANVLSEAIVAGVPVLATRIPGNIGLLGEDYPGYFEIGNTRELARLLVRVENETIFLKVLRQRCAEIAPLFAPARERAAWESLINELA